MPSAFARILVAASTLALAACANDAGGAPPGDVAAAGPQSPRRPGGRDLNVFISPSGEPFHSGRDAPYASAAWFARADADHDGKLTPAEFTADALRAFALFDTNGDGTVDAFEIQHYEQTVAPEILPRIEDLRAGEGMDETLFKGRGGGGRRRGDARPEGRSRRQVASDRVSSGSGLYGMLAEPEPLTAADADLSGSVSRKEWLDRTSRRFSLLDTSARGYLTLADLPKTQAQLILERRREREVRAAARR